MVMNDRRVTIKHIAETLGIIVGRFLLFDRNRGDEQIVYQIDTPNADTRPKAEEHFRLSFYLIMSIFWREFLPRMRHGYIILTRNQKVKTSNRNMTCRCFPTKEIQKGAICRKMKCSWLSTCKRFKPLMGSIMPQICVILKEAIKSKRELVFCCPRIMLLFTQNNWQLQKRKDQALNK